MMNILVMLYSMNNLERKKERKKDRSLNILILQLFSKEVLSFV